MAIAGMTRVFIVGPVDVQEDTVRLLQTLIRTGILDEDSAFLLREAYLTFRAKAHQLSLREQPPRVPEARFVPLRDRVRRVWERVME
ncbi:MAG TPA: hypothetical protein PL013_04260, partial [Deltaproteobacteria bacterium]|nr:hypothetical protein [Deltaproteobacteria bacterium]